MNFSCIPIQTKFIIFPLGKYFCAILSTILLNVFGQTTDTIIAESSFSIFCSTGYIVNYMEADFNSHNYLIQELKY